MCTCRGGTCGGGGWVEILCEWVDRRGVIVGGSGGGNHKKRNKEAKRKEI